MAASVRDIIDRYDPGASLAQACTVPSAWYLDPRVAELEAQSVFSRSWQVAGRAEQLRQPGQYVTWELAGEPLIVVRGGDSVLRGFYNVCRHHAAVVITQSEGRADRLRCPYHGWTYSLEGELTGVPDFGGVLEFDRRAMGLVPTDVAIWEKWVFVRLDRGGPPLENDLGTELIDHMLPRTLEKYQWVEQRRYVVACNWKVFVDNYLDGGYHVPHIHRGLDSVLDYSQYAIETGHRYCLQSSPVVTEGAEPETSAVRTGERAFYYWIYPNFMINWYQGTMDTNLVVPRGVDETEVVIDFYFTDNSESARDRNLASIEIGQKIQEEDTAICRSVQKGLASRAYDTGRLSVRREAGEHLFHRLLHADLKNGLGAVESRSEKQ